MALLIQLLRDKSLLKKRGKLFKKLKQKVEMKILSEEEVKEKRQERLSFSLVLFKKEERDTNYVSDW